MDAFFASVEQRDNPELLHQPIAVGGSKDRGVVAAASYEARKYGVRSAMASVTAYKLCPDLIFVPPRFEAYKEVSVEIRKIFERYTNKIEPLSLDEAYLDVTQNELGIETATEIAERIKKEIKDELNLVASAGVSYNKFLAKIASDVNKPDGLFVIPPSQAEAFLEKLEVRKFFGIGKVTAQKFLKMGVAYGTDLKKLSKEALVQNFGKSGAAYYDLVRGIDNREVNNSRTRKSVGAESTFEKDLYHADDLQIKVKKVAKRVSDRLLKMDKEGSTITLKIKYSDFNQITRSRTLNEKFSSYFQIEKEALELLGAIESFEKGVRLIGISISNFQEKEIKKTSQLTLNF